MRKDFIFIGFVLIISAIFSYAKGYIESGIGLIMTIAGAYIGATGFLFNYEKVEYKSKRKGLLNKWPWEK